MLTLYQYPGRDGIGSLSPPCLKILLALRRLGVEHEVVDLKRLDEVERVSPTGRVPALRMGERTIADSILILDALERDHPTADLFPDDPRERITDRLWDHFATEELYWNGFYLRWVDDEHRERLLDAIFRTAGPITRFLGRRVVTRNLLRRARAIALDRRSRGEALARFTRGVDMFLEVLGDGPFVNGRAVPGRGDLAVAAATVQAGYLDTIPPLMEALRARPAILEHARAVHRACSLDPPRWIAES